MNFTVSRLGRLQHAARRSNIHSYYRREMMSAFRPHDLSRTLPDTPPVVIPHAEDIASDASAPQVAAPPPPLPKAERLRPKLRSPKAALSIVRFQIVRLEVQADSFQAPAAVGKLKMLLGGPNPQLIRIGVRNKGCAGLSYHLDYVDQPGKFDEVVEQDGVQVIIDSKALFSIIGSEMDWKDDSLRYGFSHSFHNVRCSFLLLAQSLSSTTPTSKMPVDAENLSRWADVVARLPIIVMYHTIPRISAFLYHLDAS